MAVPNSWQDNILPKRYDSQRKTLIGTIDGINSIFTIPLPSGILDTDRTHVYLNGQLLDTSQYLLNSPSHGQITMIGLLPRPGDSFAVIA